MKLWGRWGRYVSGALGMTVACGALMWGLWGTSLAEGAWQQMEVPDTSGGLVVDPHLLGDKRLQVFFGWSSNERAVKAPEFSFSVFDKDHWNEIKAPFFGSNYAGVRNVDCAIAKYSVGVIFQNNIVEQGKDAFEVRFAISNDNGWSFSNPAVCDSFVSSMDTGSDVSIAGVGGRKASLCFGWIAENRMVKTAILDPNYRGDRPRANNMGRHGLNGARVELAGEEEGGFVSVWNDGGSLQSAYIKPLIGTSEEATTVAKGKFGLNFSASDNKGRNAMLVYDLPRLLKGNKSRRQVRRWQDGAWQVVAAAPPVGGEAPLGASLTSCQDEKGNLYVASLSRDGEKIYVSALRNGQFTPPQVAMNLKPIIGCTGFDLAVNGDYLYLFASQGPHNQMVRRPLAEV